jgi:hypothetical protein
MVIIKEIYRNNLSDPERLESREDVDQVPPRKIIDLDSGRKTLEKAWLESEENIGRLVEHSRLPVRLPDDWPEFLLTIAIIFALLLGLIIGLIGS